jgi:hypothetical protein
MKQLVTLLLMILVLNPASSFASVAHADPIQVSPPVSAVMVDPRFAQRVAEQVSAAQQLGRKLQITTIRQEIIDTNIYVYFAINAVFEQVVYPQPKPVDLGFIVGSIPMVPGGGLNVDGLWFEPPVTLPGSGASVGNDVKNQPK